MSRCWWRRGLGGCAVAALVATLPAGAEIDEGGARSQQGAALADAGPNNAGARTGLATVNVWGDLHKSVTYLSPPSVIAMVTGFHQIYPDEVPWHIPSAQSQRMTLGLDALGPGEGASMVRVRCLLNAPHDGYFLLS